MRAGSAATFFLRARVLVNVTKPIWFGCWLQRPEQERVWIYFKYERLQGLCYSCGNFGHESKHCSIPRVMAPYDKSTPKYGPFLNASKPRVFHRFPFGDFLVRVVNLNQLRILSQRGLSTPANQLELQLQGYKYTLPQVETSSIYFHSYSPIYLFWAFE